MDVIHVHCLDMVRANNPDQQRYLYLTVVTLRCTSFEKTKYGLANPIYQISYRPVINKGVTRSPNFDESHDKAAELEMARRVCFSLQPEESNDLDLASNLLRLCKLIGSPDRAWVTRGIDSFRLVLGNEVRSFLRYVRSRDNGIRQPADEVLGLI